MYTINAESGGKERYGGVTIDYKLKLTQNTQVAIYEWKRAHENVVTVSFRGSETPHLQPVLDGGLIKFFDPAFLAKFISSLQEVVADWFGTDMNVAPMGDFICGNPKVQLHHSIQQAYFLVRGNLIEKLRKKIRALTADNNNPIKIMVTGHSLGAALANLATYDLWCNKEDHLKVDGVQHELFGTITFGQFITLWRRESSNEFMKVVPKEKRMRVASCSKDYDGLLPNSQLNECGECAKLEGLDFLNPLRTAEVAACEVVKLACQAAGVVSNVGGAVFNPDGSRFGACDLVGSVFPGVGSALMHNHDEGYLQPTDHDFQAAFVRVDGGLPIMPGLAVGNDCYSVPNGFLCHLLERYSQGMRRGEEFNTGAKCKIADDPEDKLKLTPTKWTNLQSDFGCPANKWHPDWASSADEACAKWAIDWAVTHKDGNAGSLENSCKSNKWAQENCGNTCCPFMAPCSFVENTWDPGWYDFARHKKPDEVCHEWRWNSDWGALKDGQSIGQACQYPWAKENCAKVCCENSEAPVHCPWTCQTCKPGGSSDGGVGLIHGICTESCSKWGYCGKSAAYTSEGTDCSACAATMAAH